MWAPDVSSSLLYWNVHCTSSGIHVSKIAHKFVQCMSAFAKGMTDMPVMRFCLGKKCFHPLEFIRRNSIFFSLKWMANTWIKCFISFGNVMCSKLLWKHSKVAVKLTIDLRGFLFYWFFVYLMCSCSLCWYCCILPRKKSRSCIVSLQKINNAFITKDLLLMEQN